MTRKMVTFAGLLAMAVACEAAGLGTGEAKAQLYAGPGTYKVKVRGPRGYRATYYNAPTVYAAPSFVTAVPTTTIVRSYPVVTETRAFAPASVISLAPVETIYDRDVITTSAPVPVYERRYYAPAPMVLPRTYVLPY